VTGVLKILEWFLVYWWCSRRRNRALSTLKWVWLAIKLTLRSNFSEVSKMTLGRQFSIQEILSLIKLLRFHFCS